MKITGHHYGGANDPNSLMRRLATTLFAWRFPRLVFRADRGVPPPNTELSVSEMTLWFEILRAAQPVPPRSHLDGLRTYARLHGLRVEDLERDKAILIVGDQVAARGQVPGLGFLGHRWSLLVPTQLDGKPTEAVLRKRLQNVEVHGEQVIGWGAWETCTDSIAPLVSAALTASSDELTRLWKLSLALGLEQRFLPALPEAPGKMLAGQLGAELAMAADRLTVESDARLISFAMGRDDQRPAFGPLQLPESRLARLIETDRFFDHAHHQFRDTYYDSIASAFARIAAPFDLGNLLLKLKPGSALLSALDTVSLDRPDCIANYAFHPALHAEGAFTLLELQQRSVLGHQSDELDVKEEWQQAQQLGRQLLVLGNEPTDWDSLLALGVHDESQAISRRHYAQAGIDRGNAQYEDATLWGRAVSDAKRAEHFVDRLAKHLQAPRQRSDATIVFALRLLRPLRESGETALATRLAVTIADAYVAGLSLDFEVFRIPSVLPAYGGLLADLREALRADGEAWQRFLRPFNAEAYLRLARDDASELVSSARVNRAYDIAQIVRAHAETLIALAAAIEPFEEPLKAALELRDADRHAALDVGPFSWTELARIMSFRPSQIGEPVFVATGRILAHVAGRPTWLENFLCNEEEAHILAGLAAGLGPSHPLTETLRSKLRTRLEAVIADGVALGHALELANLLQLAEMPRESERFAREALTILGKRAPHGHDAFSPVARALLSSALSQQGRWAEILAFEPDRNLLVLSPHARFVESVRALALMESGRSVEAEDALRGVLKVDASNASALVNLTAVHLRAREWLKVIAVAEEAKRVISPGDNLDHILLNEAHAREKLGDRFAAATLLDALSGSASTRPDVVSLREDLRGAGSGDVAVSPIEIAAGSAVDAPPVAALLAGVETAGSADEKGRALEGLMAQLFSSILGFTITGRNVRTATEEIDIVIRNGSTDPVFSREQAIVLVECKNWSSKCGKNEFVLFKEKIENRSGRCSVGFLVSWNGFAETITKEMLRGSRERHLVVPVTGELVRTAVSSGKLLDALVAAWDEAVQT